MSFKTKTMGIAAAAALAAGLAIAAAGTAGASTAACTGGPDGAYCWNQAGYHDGLVFNAPGQVAAADKPASTYTNSTTDAGDDFLAIHPGTYADPQVKYFEYAKDGKPSGYCLSDPGPGYGTKDKIVFRPCNESMFQTWTPTQDPGNSAYYEWQNNATHQYIYDNGKSQQLTCVKFGSVGNPDNNQPNFHVTRALWTPTQG